VRNLSTDKVSKLLLVDDHPVVIAGLESFASTQPDLEVVGVARRGSDAVRRARELQPDIVVIDASLPDMSVLQATRLLRAACPRCRVLAFAQAPSALESRRLMQAGAFGYVTKEATREALLAALRAIARGERHFPQLRDGDPLEDDPPPSSSEAASRVLSRRELQVLIAIAEGKTNKQIADRLGISVRTVETHRENLMRKLGVQGAAAITRWAITQGLVDPRK
jgi:DNA-binding NarL/FixJ family response regulator